MIGNHSLRMSCYVRKEEKKEDEEEQKSKNIKDKQQAVRRDMISTKQVLSAGRGNTCFSILELHGFDAEGIFSRP